jgi:hypothetical protein
MDLLEAQQKEIRSFLEPAPLAVGSSASGSSAAGAGAAAPTAGYSPGTGAGVGVGVGPLRPISHHHAVPSRSAPGDNSAHTSSHYYAHQLDLSPQTVSSPTATVATSSGKRRAEDDDYDVDGAAGSGSAKQQRSKRNRVRVPTLFCCPVCRSIVLQC